MVASGVALSSATKCSSGSSPAPAGAEPPAGPCSIFELPTPGKASKFFAGFANFEVITRYNRSTFYASAVLELGNAIQKAREQVHYASN